MLKFEIEEQALISGLIEAISILPGGQAHVVGRQTNVGRRERVDAIVDASVAGNALRLVIETKQTAFPRDVRETIWKLRNYLTHTPEDGREIVLFFVAEAISPGARTILRDESIGFYDRGGTLYIPARHTFVYIDRPFPKKKVKVFDSIFQGQKARVMHTVFERSHDWLSVKELAERSGVSSATVSATLSEMERREWVDSQGAGPSKLRRLRAPGELLDAWRNYTIDQKPPKNVRYYVPCGDTEELARNLDRACRRAHVAYAITSEIAAQAYSPYLSSISKVRCRILPGPAQMEALNFLQARPVNEGWNLGLIQTRAQADIVVGTRINGLALSPPLQVYLDLLHGSGRSKEMAEHLRAERLGA